MIQFGKDDRGEYMETEKENILYVDDEQENLDGFVATFRRNYQIFTATCAKDAIEILKTQPIAVIITDQRMPEMTGVEFLESIIPEFPDAIRILLTGYTDADDIVKAINNARIHKYITKPWDPQDLKQHIDMGIKIYSLAKKNHTILTQLHNETSKQNRLLKMLKKYVPEDVVNQALSDETEISHLFDGELRDITVLCSSIQNLDQFTEKKDPEKVFNYLNQYFSVVESCIEEHYGMVDKFIGGSILALFGAPIANPDNQRNAAFCALRMIDKIKEFNKNNQGKSDFQLSLGITINSGPAVVGNIGSEQYMSYTAIGDTVNTTARMLEFTKDKINCVLASEPVYTCVNNVLQCESLGERKVRGKERSVQLYKLTFK